MSGSFNDSGGEDTNDGYYNDYLMENIKSPVKPSTSAQPTRTSPRKTKKSSGTNNAAPVPDLKIFKKAAMGSPLKTDVTENEREQYVENLRQLIITARTRISELEKKNDELQKRVDSDVVVICPSCTFEFKEKDHVVLPKFMRIFRPRFALEMQFYSEEDLDKYVEANRIGHDKDGVPVQIELLKPKKTLQDVGSTLSECVKEHEAKTPGKVRISLRKEPRVIPSQEPPALPQRQPNFVPAGSETPQDGLVIAEESDADSVVNGRTTERRPPPRTPLSASRKPSEPQTSCQFSSETQPVVEEKGTAETRRLSGPREEAVAIPSKKADSRLKKLKEVNNEPAIMRETFGNDEGKKKTVKGMQVRQKVVNNPPTDAKNTKEGPRRNIASRISFPKPSVPQKFAPPLDPRTPVSASSATSSEIQETVPKEQSTSDSASSGLSTDEWRSAMSGVFANPSGDIGLELPPKCKNLPKKLPEISKSTKQPEAPVLPPTVVLPETSTISKTPRRLSPRKRQLERDLEMSESPEKRPAVNTAASRNVRYLNRTAAKESDDIREPEPNTRSLERRARRDIQYRESPPPGRRDQSNRRNTRSSDTESPDRGAIRDARSIAMEHQRRREEATTAPLKSSENRQMEKSMGRSPNRRRKEEEIDRRRDEDRRRREKEDEDRRRDEDRRKRDEEDRRRKERDNEQRRREREETEKKRAQREPRIRRDYNRTVESYAISSNSVPLGQRKPQEPATPGRSRRRSPEEATSRHNQAAPRSSRRSPVDKRSDSTWVPITPGKPRRRSPVDDKEAPYSKRLRRNSSSAPRTHPSPEPSLKEDGEITDDDEEPSVMVTRSASRLSRRAAAGRDRQPENSQRSKVREERKDSPEFEVVDEDGDSDNSATIEVYDELVPIETLKKKAKLPITFEKERQKEEENLSENPQENVPIDEELTEEQEEMVIIDEEEVFVIADAPSAEQHDSCVKGGDGEMRPQDSDDSDDEEEEENKEDQEDDEEEEEEISSGSSADSEESGSEQQERVEEEEKQDDDDEEPSGSQGVPEPEVEADAEDGEEPKEEMEVSDAEEQGSSGSDASEHSAVDDESGSSSEDNDEDQEESDGEGNKRRNNSNKDDDEGSGGDDDFAEWGQIVEKDEDVFSDSFVPDEGDIED